MPEGMVDQLSRQIETDTSAGERAVWVPGSVVRQVSSQPSADRRIFVLPVGDDGVCGGDLCSAGVRVGGLAAGEFDVVSGVADGIGQVHGGPGGRVLVEGGVA